jgi:hypothetical protein
MSYDMIPSLADLFLCPDDLQTFHCQRKLGPDNRNTKVLAGKRDDFVKFLEGDIDDM